MNTIRFSRHILGDFCKRLGNTVIFALGMIQIASGQNCADYPATDGINAWPQGRVPYVFDRSVPDSVKDAMKAAMTEWMDTGAAITFVEDPQLALSNQTKPYLRISIGSRNASALGPHVPTECEIVVDMVRGKHSHATHELGHALGYPHEQSRPDRDAFVTVHTDRIVRSELHNFEVTGWECWPPGVLFTAYDYSSIMHYDWCLGSTPGCANAVKGKDDVMTTKDPFWQYRIGGWIGNDGATLSDQDRRRAQMVFGKAIWVDRTSDCTFADGRKTCDVLGFIGPYKTIPDAIAPLADFYIPGLEPRPTLMVRTGTYSRGTTGPLRIAKAMKIIAPESPIRIR